MGAYKAAIVTEGGQNLIAQALADNKTLMFTSAKTSSYAYPSGTNIAALTGLRDIVQSVIPSRSQVLNDNVAQVTARFDNDGITQQYLIQTIGLYAQIENDPEILFSIAQAITPDEMPVHSNVSPSAFVYNIHHTVQNAAQIIITVNPAGTATVADIWSIEDPEFDDSGIVEGITSFPDLLDKIRSKMNIFQFYRDLKAGLQFVLHAGQLVNNCTSEATDLPLAAAQGKALWDKITAAVTALTTHKSSGDHDGRYYTESEINNLLNAKLSISNIVNNLTSTATNMALSAAQGKALNDKINSLNGDLAALCIWKQHTINVGTLNAGTSKYDQISSIALPSGYTSAAIVGFSLDGANYTACSISKLIVRGNSVTWSVQNLGTATTGNLTLSLDVLCVKSKFW